MIDYSDPTLWIAIAALVLAITAFIMSLKKKAGYSDDLKREDISYPIRYATEQNSWV